MFPWERKEALITGDAALYYAVKAALEEHHIKFEGKSESRNFHGLNARRAILGTFGENLELENQYYIYVGKDDLEQAKYLIRMQRQKNPG